MQPLPQALLGAAPSGSQNLQQRDLAEQAQPWVLSHLPSVMQLSPHATPSVPSGWAWPGFSSKPRHTTQQALELPRSIATEAKRKRKERMLMRGCLGAAAAQRRRGHSECVGWRP